MWRYVIALVLIVHGLGHFGGIPAYPKHWSSHSWLLTSLVGDAATRAIGGLLWIVTALLFVAAGLGVFGVVIPQTAWRSLAIVSAVVSLVVMLLFWDVLLGGPKIGALFDVVILVALLWAHWPSAALVGS